MDQVEISDFGDLNSYWGVELCSIQILIDRLALRFELRWTDSGEQNSRFLTFIGLSKMSLSGISLASAERIELISIAAREADGIEVSCEMSNLEMDFKCSAIFVG